jgi:hypothetical protein
MAVASWEVEETTITQIDFVYRRAQGEGRVAVQCVQNFVLDLTDGVAVENSALDLLFQFFRCQGDRLQATTKGAKRRMISR